MKPVHRDALWFSESILTWFEAHGRELPWRRTEDLYVILISEVLLRRSRSTTVAKVLEDFLARWPDTATLAAADPASVAEVIRPLGLTSRSVQLVALADRLHSAEALPRTAAELRELPGVGRYVAAATLGLPTVDGTSARVYRRFYGLIDHRPDKTVDDELWSHVIVNAPEDASRSRKLNWAVLDLAAQVCLPSRPTCSTCPLRARCFIANSSLRPSDSDHQKDHT